MVARKPVVLMTNATEQQEQSAQFAALSAILTGYSTAELYGTGCLEDYQQHVLKVLPPDLCAAFFASGPDLLELKDADPEEAWRRVRQEYLSSEAFGPPARALIELWYLGQWSPLPEDWRQAYGSSRFDVAKIISARAYKEGLVWNAIGAHPMGAKQQGFGAWALPPQRPEA
jgi:hypothetical protein